MVAGVQPIRVHGAQILDLELDKGFGKLGLEAEGDGEGVSFELVVAGEDVHQEFHDGVHRGEGVGEEDEADDYGAEGVEAEGGVEGGVVDENAEEGENVECVELRFY